MGYAVSEMRRLRITRFGQKADRDAAGISVDCGPGCRFVRYHRAIGSRYHAAKVLRVCGGTSHHAHVLRCFLYCLLTIKIHEAGVYSNLHEVVWYFDFGDCFQIGDVRCRRIVEKRVKGFDLLHSPYGRDKKFIVFSFLSEFYVNIPGDGIG